MISEFPAELGCDAKWVIKPTRSMSWREAKIFVAAVSALSLGIGLWFLCRGYPFVLPFSGLEALAVAIAFYIVLRDGENREVISIFPRTVVIEKGRYEPNFHAEFDRTWVKVVLARSPRGWYPSRLSITSHGRATELGSFLTNGEREALAIALINAIEKNR
ncbi:MAG: putative membrane protein [Gammaproteobacteria bacterium]|jgi:uncharacterized membrane protein